jgi:RNA 3'-terminal phosphate cyclase (ATP)
MKMIELDGSSGEGGGQILRSALTLSMITGQAFRVTKIRANRPKPGLMRQHLVAVQAAAQVCQAETSPLKIGADTLEFFPGKIRAGEYNLAIGSAGSCTLVLQTLLPALWQADAASSITISGGTHNAMAPPAQFLQRAYGRVLAQMGVKLDLQLQRFGFYPAGGGQLQARIEPCPQLQRIELIARGARTAGYAESFIAGVPFQVAERELAGIGQGMGWDDAQLLVRGLPKEQGPGNALLLTLEQEHVTEVFCAFGEKAVRSETVANTVLAQVRAYLRGSGALGPYLADQVMLPMALAGGGCYTTDVISQHSRTNAEVIARFLPVRIEFHEHESGANCVMIAGF